MLPKFSQIFAEILPGFHINFQKLSKFNQILELKKFSDYVNFTNTSTENFRVEKTFFRLISTPLIRYQATTLPPS